jgi:hypothetical protein
LVHCERTRRDKIVVLAGCRAQRHRTGGRHIALLEGRHQEAPDFLLEYLKMADQVHDKASIAAGLEGLAAVAAEEGRAERATRLFAAAESLREEIGGRLMSLRNLTMIEHAVSSTRERLGEEAWLAAWEEGQAMTVEHAVAMAWEKDSDPDAATT